MGDWPIFGRDGPDVAWRPDPAAAEAARLTRFLRATGEPSLDALQARAVTDPGWFWGAAAEDIAVAWQRPPRSVVDTSGGPAWARWWIGGAFDWSWAAVEPRAARDPDGIAVTWEGEDGAVRELTNRELSMSVWLASEQLRGCGVGPGDRVGILLPMLP
ncbi:MAG TPA: acetyl-coenzyme A synthetase N-terminal domain-containing protein, partial [Candidatus Limnocylindrales bacterium]